MDIVAATLTLAAERWAAFGETSEREEVAGLFCFNLFSLFLCDVLPGICSGLLLYIVVFFCVRLVFLEICLFFQRFVCVLFVVSFIWWFVSLKVPC